MKLPRQHTESDKASLSTKQMELLASALRARDRGLLHVHARPQASTIARQITHAFEAAGWVVASDHATDVRSGICIHQGSATFSHFLAVASILTDAGIPFTQDNSSSALRGGYVEVWVS